MVRRYRVAPSYAATPTRVPFRSQPFVGPSVHLHPSQRSAFCTIHLIYDTSQLRARLASNIVLLLTSRGYFSSFNQPSSSHPFCGSPSRLVSFPADVLRAVLFFFSSFLLLCFLFATPFSRDVCGVSIRNFHFSATMAFYSLPCNHLVSSFRIRR